MSTNTGEQFNLLVANREEAKRIVGEIALYDLCNKGCLKFLDEIYEYHPKMAFVRRVLTATEIDQIYKKVRQENAGRLVARDAMV